MKILDKVISVIAPFTCLGCGVEEDHLICEGCAESLPLVPSRCYKCRAVTDDYAVCKGCSASTPLRTVVVYTFYQGLAKELVHRTKYERARKGIYEIAKPLADSVPSFPAHAILTHIPTATSRVRSRGYDHALLLARVLGDNGPKASTTLARTGQAHQVGASRAERLRQLNDAFRPVRASSIQGKHVILVDDVLTTGATLEAAAKVLKRAGAKRVDAIVYAQV